MNPDHAKVSAPRRAADSLVEYVNSERFRSVGDLFAEDAIWLTPHGGPTIIGRENIREHYNSLISPMRPTIRIASYLEQGNECAFELEASKDGEAFQLAALDRFTLNSEGLITRFAVFVRGESPNTEG